MKRVILQSLLVGALGLAVFAARARAEESAGNVAQAAAMESAPAAAVAAKVDTGDTAWILISAALVLFMTPGLAFFYGGLVRRKNVLSILMQCFMLMCLITVQWVL